MATDPPTSSAPPAALAAAGRPNERLKGAVSRALRDPAPAGDLRAFALDELTCVVRWKPSESSTGAAYWKVEMRLRQGERLMDHSMVLPDLGMLARTCEHHLAHFAAGSRAAPAAARAAPRNRLRS